MNLRLACDTCGQQPCMCQEVDCPKCEGKGECDRMHLRPQMIECDACNGEGVLRCNGPAATAPSCRLEALGAQCACEAAWERQQEDIGSEPPPSARERQERAQEERDALRSGRPI